MFLIVCYSTFARTCNRFFRSVLTNVNPNSYAVCWSDPVALLRYFVILAYPFRFSGEYLYPLLRVFHVGVNIEGCNAFPLLLLQR